MRTAAPRQLRPRPALRAGGGPARQLTQAADIQHAGHAPVTHVHFRLVLLPALLHQLFQRLGHVLHQTTTDTWAVAERTGGRRVKSPRGGRAPALPGLHGGRLQGQREAGSGRSRPGTRTPGAAAPARPAALGDSAGRPLPLPSCKPSGTRPVPPLRARARGRSRATPRPHATLPKLGKHFTKRG